MCRLGSLRGWRSWGCFKGTPNTPVRGQGAHSPQLHPQGQEPRVGGSGGAWQAAPLPPSLPVSLSARHMCFPSLDCSSCHPLHEQFVLEPSSFPKEAIPANSISGQGREVAGNADKIYEVPISSSPRTRKGCLSCQSMIN